MSGALTAAVDVELGGLHLDVALEVPAGEAVAVVGPNGSGKTTLLRALAGLQPVRRGRVALGGRLLEDTATGVFVPPEQRPIGVVFQDARLFPHLSVLDNAAFGLLCRGHTRSGARRRAAAWLERVGLGAHARARPHELSGGQAQRLALARALAGGPRLLLLDEPSAALDATTRLSTRRELGRRLDAYDGVVVLVTHDPIEAMALAGRLVVLEGGRVVQEGVPAEISARPRSRYVADLVGVNLLPGRARAGQVHVGSSAPLVVADAADGDVFAVVHPRAVALHRRPPEGTPRNVWRGVAEGLDREGERVRVRVGGQLPVVAEVTPAAVADLGLDGGGEVWVSVKATEITVYPA